MALIVQAVGSIISNENVGNITPVLPAHAVDDLLVVLCGRTDLNGEPQGVLTTATSGWAKRNQKDNTNRPGALALFFKKATSASETNPQIDDDQGAAGPDMMAVALTLRGQDLTTPFDAADTTDEDADAGEGTCDAPSIMTVTDGALSLVSFFTVSTNPVYSLPTSGWVIEAQGEEAAGTDRSQAVLSNTIETASATGVVEATMNENSRWCSLHVVVRPEVAVNPSVSDTATVTEFDKQNLKIQPTEFN